MNSMKTNDKVTVTFGTKTLEADKGTRLSQVAGTWELCGGRGICGKCKLIAHGEVSPLSERERELLTPDEIKMGVRLGCIATAEGDCTILPMGENDSANILSEGVMPHFEVSPAFSEYGAAIDIGTTTLAARLYDVRGVCVADSSMLNPQIKYGADVISRISHSLEGGGNELCSAVCGAIDQMLCDMARDAKISPQSIDAVTLTGNTAMLYFATDTCPSALSKAPFEADRLFGESICAEKMGIKSLLPQTEIYLAPCISAFVGGDVVCAILASELCDSTKTEFLCDIGTNGEMALWHNGMLTVCSTAAGPAFEGVGISMGMRAARGAVDRVVTAGGRLEAHVIGDCEAVGICAGGLVDAVSCLLQNETLDETGCLDDEPAYITKTVTLTGRDIRMVQLAKSAICAGIETLLNEAKIGVSDVHNLNIAGGFGKHLNIKNAVLIGLLPKINTDSVRLVGNAALSGACMLTLNKALRQKCEHIAKRAVTLDLAQNKFFADCFTMGIMF